MGMRLSYFVLKLPVAGAHIRRTGRLGNVGYVGYYWTRSVVPTNRWYRYARYLGFGDYASVGTLKPVGQTPLPSVLARNALRKAPSSSTIFGRVQS
jgi:hypothetical protein